METAGFSPPFLFLAVAFRRRFVTSQIFPLQSGSNYHRRLRSVKTLFTSH
jgi:hypothetical protein